MEQDTGAYAELDLSFVAAMTMNQKPSRIRFCPRESMVNRVDRC